MSDNFLSYCSKIYESREAWSPSTDSPSRRKTHETAENLLGIASIESGRRGGGEGVDFLNGIGNNKKRRHSHARQSTPIALTKNIYKMRGCPHVRILLEFHRGTQNININIYR